MSHRNAKFEDTEAVIGQSSHSWIGDSLKLNHICHDLDDIWQGCPLQQTPAPVHHPSYPEQGKDTNDVTKHPPARSDVTIRHFEARLSVATDCAEVEDALRTGDQAALKIARLGRPVKIMIGGLTGWKDEGFAFAIGSEPGEIAQ